MKKPNENGFTYIEVMCAMVVLMIGILGQLSALSLSILRQTESEQQSKARQIASSTLESIFAARDLGTSSVTGISSFDKINNTGVGNGIFVGGWYPVRQSAGKDGIQGTKDDVCAYNTNCQGDNYSNTSALVDGFERNITITDVAETDTPTIKKRRLEVRIRYYVGQLRREQMLATVIADLPFYK